jgi:uncharacterized membrane protein (UPF0127 family)
MRLSVLAAAALLATAIAACSSNEPTSPTTPGFTVAFSGGTVTAAIAATGAARANGLMGRTSLAADSGMLFVFVQDQDSVLGARFFMKDTPIDLSIAFLDVNKKVLQVREMTRNDAVTLYHPGTAYRYALEANKGWFSSHGVTAGATATFTLPAGTAITP